MHESKSLCCPTQVNMELRLSLFAIGKCMNHTTQVRFDPLLQCRNMALRYIIMQWWVDHGSSSKNYKHGLKKSIVSNMAVCSKLLGIFKKESPSRSIVFEEEEKEQGNLKNKNWRIHEWWWMWRRRSRWVGWGLIEWIWKKHRRERMYSWIKRSN